LSIGASHALWAARVDIADAAILQVDGMLDATTLSGSGGTDTLYIAATGHVTATGDLGDGDDLLDVAGTLDTRDGVFSLGAGDDILVVHDSTRIVGTLDAGLGNDRLTVDVRTGAEVAMGSATGFESLGKAGQGTLAFEGAAAFLDVVVDGGRLAIAADAHVAARDTRIAAGARLDLAGTFGGTAANDTLDVAGHIAGPGGIDLGAGDDTLTLRDGADLSGLATAVDGGDGDDRLRVSVAGDATLGGATGFESLQKRDIGTLRIAGPVASRFTRIDVTGGTLALGTHGSVDGVQAFHVDADTSVDNAGAVRFTDAADTARVDGAWSGTGTFDMAAGDDALVVTGAWAGDIALGAGDDTLTFAAASLHAAHIDGGQGDDDRVAFLGMVFEPGTLPTFAGVERVRLLDATHAGVDGQLDLGGGALEVDASSSLFVDAAARIAGHVDTAGLVRTGDARLAIEGDYIAREGARLSVSVSPSNTASGGLDIRGDVRGDTGVVFASDGTSGFAPATILVVSAPDDRPGDGVFYAADAIDGLVRLDGSPFAWSFEHDIAQRGWVLRTGEHAPLVPELPGYGALPTIAALATDDTHRLLRERISALRSDARTCTPQGHATVAGACRGAWMAVFDGDLDLGANPGVAVRGDLRGMLAGTDRVFPARDTTFRAGVFGGLVQGDHATTGANSSAHAGVGAARLRSTTPVLGFHAGITTDTGRYLDAQLIAQGTSARVHATGGFTDTQRGTGLSLRTQAGTRHAIGDWRIEPQLELGLAAHAWRDRYGAGGHDVVLADDATGHLRASLRVERPFPVDAGTLRPWATFAMTDVQGEAADALRLRAPTGEVFGLPNHARGLGTAVDVGLDATLADGLHLHATLSASESLRGTSASGRQATLGLRWRW
jgi:fibronectin-binding autotransporter adhesin